MQERVCPICGEAAEPRERNRAFPFCSNRCQLVDLGHWLSGDYRIPGDPIPEDDDLDDGAASAAEILEH